MTTQPGLEPMPHPPGHVLVGNVFDIDTVTPVQSLMWLARQYGPIFQLDIAGRRTLVVVSGFSLVDEVSDDRRFDKSLGSGLRNGQVYIMQSYAQIVDPTQTEASLETLASRLQLPQGWHYRVRRLDQDYVVQTTGEAYVLQDDFENTYQRVDS